MRGDISLLAEAFGKSCRMSNNYPPPPMPPSPPPPDPFGDPTKVNRENKAAIGKGIGCGCGIIATILVGLLALVLGIATIVMSVMRNSDAVTMTVDRARASQALTAEIGTPVEMGWFLGGTINIDNGKGTADVTVPVNGPKGGASIHTRATKEPDSGWVLHEATATVDASGTKIDLLDGEKPQ